MNTLTTDDIQAIAKEVVSLLVQELGGLCRGAAAFDQESGTKFTNDQISAVVHERGVSRIAAIAILRAEHRYHGNGQANADNCLSPTLVLPVNQSAKADQLPTDVGQLTPALTDAQTATQQEIQSMPEPVNQPFRNPHENGEKE